tara:strand:+ start:3178 stop:3564 length:387 start_codon:yes stop_codon:yes gene_type:complete
MSNERYRLISDTEGWLSIEKDDEKIFFCDGILLVEFARALANWINNTHKKSEDFIYNSMDFEDEPLIAIIKNKGYFLESSITGMENKYEISLNEFIDSAISFLKEIRCELTMSGVDFSKYDSFDLINS